MTAIPLPLISRNRLWSAAQAAGVLLTVVLLAGLLRWPTPTLHILWDMVIPVLPAVFLVNPMLWRNVCPLATLNSFSGERVGTRPLGSSMLGASWVVGIVLLGVMVPARRFLFNEQGAVLAATVAGVAVLALALGLVVARRGGFCNALCPVLPVEKLYGQSPLVSVGSARCGTCALCVRHGCIDLVGGNSAFVSVGRGRRGYGWLASSFGVFAAAFPGFVMGYFTTGNTTPAGAGAIYAHVLVWTAGSYLLTVLVVWFLRVRAAFALPVLGAAAVGLYYWFAAPSLARAYSGPDAGPSTLRVAALGLVSVWLGIALRRAQLARNHS